MFFPWLLIVQIFIITIIKSLSSVMSVSTRSPDNMRISILKEYPDLSTRDKQT